MVAILRRLAERARRVMRSKLFMNIAAALVILSGATYFFGFRLIGSYMSSRSAPGKIVFSANDSIADESGVRRGLLSATAPTLIYFLDVQCGPCRLDAAGYQAFADSIKGYGVEARFIVQSDGIATAQYRRLGGFKTSMLVGSRWLYWRKGIRMFPTVVLAMPSGVVAARWTGRHPRGAERLASAIGRSAAGATSSRRQ